MSVWMERRSLMVTRSQDEAPAWKGSVARWSQLDDPAYGLADWAWRWGRALANPDFVYLASRGASNVTDRDFVKLGAGHPAQFVHTLPSARASAFCQVLPWAGPLLCFQKDPQTVISALREAAYLVDTEGFVVWILSVLLDEGQCRVEGFQIAREGSQQLQRCSDSRSTKDDELWCWLDQPKGTLVLGSGWKIDHE